MDLHRRHRQWCLKIDTFIQGLIFFRQSFLFYRFYHQQETICRRHFWHTRYHVPRSATVLQYHQVFMQFLSVIWCAIIPVIRHKEKEKEVTHRILLLCFFDGSMEYFIVLKSYCKLTKCINFGGLWSRCWAGL